MALPELAASICDENVIFGYLGESVVTVFEALKNFHSPCQLTVIVGPEGGITDDEGQLLVDSGAKPVRLGNTIFRVETAGVALVAASRAIIGNIT